MSEEIKPQYSSELFVSEGNLTKDPFDITKGDKEACAFRIACNTRNRHEDEATFFRSVIVQNASLAEHCLNSLSRGDRVLVYGMVTCNVWEDKDGNVNEQEEIRAIGVGASLRWHDVTIHEGRGYSRDDDDDDDEGDDRPARGRRRSRRGGDEDDRPARSRRGRRNEDPEDDDDDDDDEEERPSRRRSGGSRSSGRMNRSGGRRGVSRHTDDDDDDDDL